MDFVKFVILKEHPGFPRHINKVRQLIFTASCIYNYCRELGFKLPPAQKYQGKNEVYWTRSLWWVKYSNANVVVMITNLNRSLLKHWQYLCQSLLHPSEFRRWSLFQCSGDLKCNLNSLHHVHCTDVGQKMKCAYSHVSSLVNGRKAMNQVCSLSLALAIPSHLVLVKQVGSSCFYQYRIII